MSLTKMLTKMAIGFAVAKGMQKVSQAGGIKSVLGGLTQGNSTGGTTNAGGLSDIMGSLGNAGAANNATGASSGGLGGMLGSLTGGGGNTSAGGLGDLLGGLAGSNAGGLGGLGGLLGGLASARGGSGGSLEALLKQETPDEEPDDEDTAGLMIRAMVMAARSDGEIDADEQEKLLSTLGEDAGQDEMDFVRQAMQAPVDVDAIASDTPRGLETQVYSMSVMSITPDNSQEANYLHTLAKALDIQPATINEIHDNFGVPRLYS
ncbi:MAG: DUF533 domain-containing protein [Litoreibacter sp.]